MPKPYPRPGREKFLRSWWTQHCVMIKTQNFRFQLHCLIANNYPNLSYKSRSRSWLLFLINNYNTRLQSGDYAVGNIMRLSCTRMYIFTLERGRLFLFLSDYFVSLTSLPGVLLYQLYFNNSLFLLLEILSPRDRGCKLYNFLHCN